MENGTPAPREIEVQLGQHKYLVVPQRHAYLQRKIPEVVSGFGDTEITTGGGAMLGQLTPQVHALLSIFIPADRQGNGGLMPLHEWQGFGSADAMERDAYTDEDDNSPDTAQIVEAFKAVARVNRFDLVGVLKDWIGPSFLRGTIQQLVGTQLANLLEEQTSSGNGSGSLPQPSGASTPTTGTTPARTPAPSAAGPSPESQTS